MPNDLTAYLATHYLVADPKPSSKKRKRKREPGLVIQDDDDDASWTKTSGTLNDDDEDGPLTMSGFSTEFRKTKSSNWKLVGTKSTSRGNGDENAAADAVIASAAAEQAASKDADDELPVIQDEKNVIKMSDGSHAGLQSASAVAAQLARRRQEELDDFTKTKTTEKEEETVYRDATGRRIDAAMRRAEARRAILEAEEKEKKAKEALKGDVQIEEARKRREQLEDAQLMTFARTVDDEDLNREQKEQQRWNDPMAQFLTQKETTEPTSRTKGSKAAQRKPVYPGAAPPNRYGIKPGYRWDGVDRSNGFEAERFKALNRRERNKNLDYAWQMDE